MHMHPKINTVTAADAILTLVRPAPSGAHTVGG